MENESFKVCQRAEHGFRSICVRNPKLSLEYNIGVQTVALEKTLGCLCFVDLVSAVRFARYQCRYPGRGTDLINGEVSIFEIAGEGEIAVENICTYTENLEAFYSDMRAKVRTDRAPHGTIGFKRVTVLRQVLWAEIETAAESIWGVGCFGEQHIKRRRDGQ